MTTSTDKLHVFRKGGRLQIIGGQLEEVDILPDCPDPFLVRFTLVEHYSCASPRRFQVLARVRPLYVIQDKAGTRSMLSVFEAAQEGEKIPTELWLFQEKTLLAPVDYFNDRTEILLSDLEQLIVEVD